jgi:hypothetical protein
MFLQNVNAKSPHQVALVAPLGIFAPLIPGELTT